MKKSQLQEMIRGQINEAMSRKDFVFVARLLRIKNPKQQMDFAVQHFKQQNPRFDEARFRAAVETGKGI